MLINEHESYYWGAYQIVVFFIMFKFKEND